MLRKSRWCVGIGIGMMFLAYLATPGILPAAPAPAQKTAAAPKAAPAGAMVKVFTIGMGTSGVGTVQTLSSGWSALISKYAPFKSVVENSPTMKTKSQHITNGTIHAYMFAAQAPLDEYVGGEAGKGTKTRIRALTFSDYPASTIMAFCTRPDSGVKTIKDLKGKVVYAEYAPSPYMARMADAVLAVNGMKRKDVTWLKFTSSEDAYREVKEKRAQAIFFPMGVGSIDLSSTVGLFVVPFSEAEQKAIEKATPAFYAYTISKGDNGANADTPVVASDLPGNLEILENERNGLIFPCGNVEKLAAALIRIFSDDSLRERLGRAARESYESRWRLERFQQQMLEKFCSCISARGNKHGLGTATPRAFAK